MMTTVKVKWVGHSRVFPGLGIINENQELKMFKKDVDFYLQAKLIELVEPTAPPKTKTKGES